MVTCGLPTRGVCCGVLCCARAVLQAGASSMTLQWQPRRHRGTQVCACVCIALPALANTHTHILPSSLHRYGTFKLLATTVLLLLLLLRLLLFFAGVALTIDHAVVHARADPAGATPAAPSAAPPLCYTAAIPCLLLRCWPGAHAGPGCSPRGRQCNHICRQVTRPGSLGGAIMQSRAQPVQGAAS